MRHYPERSSHRDLLSRGSRFATYVKTFERLLVVFIFPPYQPDDIKASSPHFGWQHLVTTLTTQKATKCKKQVAIGMPFTLRSASLSSDSCAWFVACLLPEV